ncbi:uncharacterized protein VTP21DRAFT_296 [Calcarisporiella thermophila]|uniref:uncharacterized protein n=1 Tax=Calcarisporiella thermophila TaxID=911321 RepID=UPI003743F0BA
METVEPAAPGEKHPVNIQSLYGHIDPRDFGSRVVHIKPSQDIQLSIEEEQPTVSSTKSTYFDKFESLTERREKSWSDLTHHCRLSLLPPVSTATSEEVDALAHQVLRTVHHYSSIAGSDTQCREQLEKLGGQPLDPESFHALVLSAERVMRDRVENYMGNEKMMPEEKEAGAGSPYAHTLGPERVKMLREEDETSRADTGIEKGGFAWEEEEFVGDFGENVDFDYTCTP